MFYSSLIHQIHQWKGIELEISQFPTLFQDYQHIVASFIRFPLSRIIKLRIIWLIFDVGYSMNISIIISIQDCKCERVFILQVLVWYVGSITTCQPVSFHKRIVIMVDYSQQFSISILSFTFLFSGTILFLPSIICLFITYAPVHYGHACNSWFHYSLSSKVIVSFLLYGIQNNISIW